MTTTIRSSLRGLTFLLSTVLLAGCAMFGWNKETTSITIFEEVSDNMPGKLVRSVTIPQTGLTVPVYPYASMSDKHLVAAALVPTVGGSAIRMQFDHMGRMELAELTTRCRGQRLVIFLNNSPVAVWRVNRILDKGEILIEGNFTDAEAKKAVEGLNRAAKKRANE